MTSHQSISGFQRPWYTLRIDAGGAPYDIRVNDCPVIDDEQGYGVTTRLPINIWLHPGENELSVALRRGRVVRGRCSVTVRLTERERQRDDGPIMAELQLDAPPLRLGRDDDADDDSRVMLRKRVVFTADLPFHRPRWEGVAPIDDPSPGDLQAAGDLARRFWEALRDRDVARVAGLLTLKSEEISQARYMTAEQRRAELEDQLSFVFDPAEWRLADLDLTDLELRPYAGGRLFRLVDAVTGESPIHFVDPQRMVGSYLELVLYRDAELRWHIIR